MFSVSIIMPVYNVEDHLERAIQCALNQTKQDCEIILVNDGSTDRSVEICEEYARKEPLMIQLIHQENKGSGAARNAGLEKAAGKYIYFADPDDYFKPTLIQHNFIIAEEKESDVVVFGYTEEKAGAPNEKAGAPNEKETKLPSLPNLSTKEAFRKHFRNFYYFSPYALWNKLYRKEFLIANGISFTEQRLGQDALFNIDVFQEVERVAFNRRAYYHYVTHDGSAVNRYRSDRFALEYNIADRFEQLIESWEMSEEYTDIIAQEFWHPVYLELANVTHIDCPMTPKEKEEWISWIFKYKKIEKHLKEHPNFKEKNPFRRALLYAVKNEQPNRAIKLMQTRNTVSQNYDRLFSKARAFFRT